MADAFDKPPGTSVPVGTEQINRRKDLRVGVNLDAEVEEPKAKAQVRGRVTDISLGGCYVDVMTTFPVGTLVSARISRDGQLFQADAEVRYSKEGLGMGLAFTNMHLEEQARLLRWAEELLISGTIDLRTEKSTPSKMRESIPFESDPTALQLLIRILMRKGVLTHFESDQLLREVAKSLCKG